MNINIDLSFISNFFNDIGNIFTSFFTWLAKAIVAIVSGVLYVVLDGFFTVCLGVVSAIDLSTLITGQFAQWGLLPEQLIYLINITGIPQGLAMVGYAYGIRMLLNLIPSAITRV